MTAGRDDIMTAGQGRYYDSGSGTKWQRVRDEMTAYQGRYYDSGLASGGEEVTSRRKGRIGQSQRASQLAAQLKRATSSR